MKNIYLQFDGWFKSRVIRERWLLSMVILLVAAWLSWIVLLEPAKQKYENLATDYNNRIVERDTLKNDVANLAVQAEIDPNVLLRQRLQQSLEQRDELGRLLDEKAEFMQPQQLLAWLEALLESGTGLTLEEFTTSAPESFLENNDELVDVKIMQYPVTVKLAGDFFAIHDYLEALSDLPLSFYWQSFDYQVVEHPKALITLELFTLSYSEGHDEM
ncbi:MAG TPA: hypothetical protein VKY35_08555 [Aliidiomarina sp.]|nr:hypothetical protein [Aliidiomarina sp.]